MSEVRSISCRAGVREDELLHLASHATCDSVLHSTVAGVTNFLVFASIRRALLGGVHAQSEQIACSHYAGMLLSRLRIAETPRGQGLESCAMQHPGR